MAPAGVALAWLLNREGVSAPIVGATRLTRLQDAVAAVDVTLSPAHMERLEAEYSPRPVAGHE